MALPKVWSDGLPSHIIATLIRTLVGFVSASIIGICIGVLIGRSKLLYSLLMPVIDLLRPLPSSAVIPVIILFSGFNESTYVAAIIFGGTWPVLMSTADGVSRIDPITSMAICQLKITRIRKLFLLLLPEAAPSIMTGMRISLAVCLILAVTAELLIGKESGVGNMMTLLDRAGDYLGMYVCLLVLAILGLILNQTLLWSEKMIPWIKNRYPDF